MRLSFGAAHRLSAAWPRYLEIVVPGSGQEISYQDSDHDALPRPVRPADKCAKRDEINDVPRLCRWEDTKLDWRPIEFGYSKAGSLMRFGQRRDNDVLPQRSDA